MVPFRAKGVERQQQKKSNQVGVNETPEMEWNGMWNFRIFFESNRHDEGLPQQLTRAAGAMAGAMKGHRVLKISLFVTCPTIADYEEAHRLLAEEVSLLVPETFIFNVIPQGPAGGGIALEVWFTDMAIDLAAYGAGEGWSYALFSGEDDLLIVSTQSHSGYAATDSRTCFAHVGQILRSTGFGLGQLVRQWNYIGGITESDQGKNQRYQQFNDERAKFFASGAFDDGYPAATGIGMDVPGVIVEGCFLRSGKTKVFPLRNPVQVDAHRYSDQVLKATVANPPSTPKFERGKLLIGPQEQTVFVSGTAAIFGEATTARGTLLEQTADTIGVVKALLALRNIREQTPARPSSCQIVYGRVYVKKGLPWREMNDQLAGFFGPNPFLVLEADVCRPELLVEMEAVCAYS